jgi:PAS domain S-box-containing protein
MEEIEKQNRLVAENLVDAVWVIDAKSLTYDYITPSIYDISGYTPEELVNSSFIDRLTPESLTKCTELLTQALKERAHRKEVTRSIELELMHKDGGSYWVEIRAKFLEKPDSPLKIVGITRDITNKKTIEQQLQNQNKKLTEALAEKERLLEEIRVLRQLLPVCSGCKRIRDDDGKWWPLDLFVKEHTGSEFTHTICSDCKDVLYSDILK